MNAAHLHLIVNHIPILAVAFGILVLAVGLIRKSADLKKMGLLLFVIAALFAIPTFLSGEPADDIVENLPGVTEKLIHEHEEMGEKAFIAAEVLGGLSLLTLLLSLRSQGAPNFLFLLSFLLSLGVSGALSYTAMLGGEIRHTEIRKDFAAPPPSPDHHKHEH